MPPKTQSVTPKTPVTITEHSTLEFIKQKLFLDPSFTESGSGDNFYIHQKLVPSEKEFVVIKPAAAYKSSPIIPKGEGGKTGYYMTLTCHPKKDERTDEYVENKAGTDFITLIENLQTTYADAMDENMDLKKKITTKVMTGDVDEKRAKIAKPTNKLVVPLIQRNLRIDGFDFEDPLYGTEDKTKSPTCLCKIWTGPPKEEHLANPNNNLFTPAGDAVYTKIFFDSRFDRSYKGKEQYIRVLKWDQLTRFIYQAGDSKKGKPKFDLMFCLEFSPPTTYWNKNRGVTKIALTKVVITGMALDTAFKFTPQEQRKLALQADTCAEEYGFKSCFDIEEGSGEASSSSYQRFGSDDEDGYGIDTTGDLFDETEQPRRQLKRPHDVTTDEGSHKRQKFKTNPVAVYATKPTKTVEPPSDDNEIDFGDIGGSSQMPYIDEDKETDCM